MLTVLPTVLTMLTILTHAADRAGLPLTVLTLLLTQHLQSPFMASHLLASNSPSFSACSLVWSLAAASGQSGSIWRTAG